MVHDTQSAQHAQSKEHNTYVVTSCRQSNALILITTMALWWQNALSLKLLKKSMMIFPGYYQLMEVSETSHLATFKIQVWSSTKEFCGQRRKFNGRSKFFCISIRKAERLDGQKIIVINDPVTFYDSFV